MKNIICLLIMLSISYSYGQEENNTGEAVVVKAKITETNGTLCADEEREFDIKVPFEHLPEGRDATWKGNNPVIVSTQNDIFVTFPKGFVGKKTVSIKDDKLPAATDSFTYETKILSKDWKNESPDEPDPDTGSGIINGLITKIKGVIGIKNVVMDTINGTSKPSGVRDCCKDGKVIKEGEKYSEFDFDIDTTATISLVGADIKVGINLGFGNGAIFKVNAGVNGQLKIGKSSNALFGERTQCDGTECAYWNIKGTLQAKLAVGVTISLCIKTFGLGSCEEIDANVADVSVILSFYSKGGSKESCGDGKSGADLEKIYANVFFFAVNGEESSGYKIPIYKKKKTNT